MSQSLIEALQDPARFDHDVDHFEVIETHISWVLLTGDYAYKIKKPVDFGFLDFSSLDKRHHYCLEELRLNRRLAPSIYLDVVAIGGTANAPELNATTGVFEYAVRMRQFDEHGRLDHLLEADRLNTNHIDQLADELALFHQTNAVADDTGHYGEPEVIYHFINENFEQIRPLLNAEQHRQQLALLESIEQWCRQVFAVSRDALVQRKRDGFIRECHGDAHLANMVYVDNQVTLFDCLEFNPDLRWIDVISEIAFIVMDLDDRGRSNLANRLLDRYLQRTGDYAGLRLLRFYQVYRACVRAKVDALRLQQMTEGKDYEAGWNRFCTYLELAASYTRAIHPLMVCCFGLSGSGKTTVSQQLLETLPLIRLRSDVERKRLFGLALEAKTPKENIDKLYGKEATRRTFDRLIELVGRITAAGFAVVVDATFLRRAQRRQFRQLARSLGIGFVLLAVTADVAVMKRRIADRRRHDADASEADIAVLERQQAWLEPLTTEEAKLALTVVNNDGLDLTGIRDRLNTLLNEG